MSSSTLQLLATLCLILGFLSIFGAIAIWYKKTGDTPEAKANAERFGIFVGLWAPTFFALAVYFRLVS